MKMVNELNRACLISTIYAIFFTCYGKIEKKETLFRFLLFFIFQVAPEPCRVVGLSTGAVTRYLLVCRSGWLGCGLQHGHFHCTNCRGPGGVALTLIAPVIDSTGADAHLRYTAVLPCD